MRALVVLVLLAIPLLVVAALPRVFEFAGSLPTIGGPRPPRRRRHFDWLTRRPRPNASRRSRSRRRQHSSRPRRRLLGRAPRRPASASSSPIRAVWARYCAPNQSADAPIASLREQLEVTLLERRQVGGTEWARVRTPDGQEGWVLGVVARPAPAPRP